MELRGRAIPEPWPTPPVHFSLEMEASLLDSGVQELFETEHLGAHGLTSNALLQWAVLTEFSCVVGLFELNRGEANFIKISADLESQLEIVSDVPREFIHISPDERPQHSLSLSAPRHRLAQSHQKRCACAPTS